MFTFLCHNRFLQWVSPVLAAVVCAAGLFAEAVIADDAASPTGRIAKISADDNDSGNGEASPQPKRQTQTREEPRPVQNFFSRLRFWENDKEKEKKPSKPNPPPKPDSRETGNATAYVNANAAVNVGAVPRPETRNGTGYGTGSVRTARIPEPPLELADSNIAPVPPPIERMPSRNFSGDGRNVLDDGRGAGTFRAVIPAASAYSYDTRDWVDSYPPQEMPAPAAEPKVASRSPAPPTHDWNGDAVNIADLATKPIPTAGNSPPSAVPERTASGTIDLSPSYSKRLPHVKTHGVLVIQANFPLTDIDLILREYQALQNDLHRYIGVPEAKEKIELCLFKDDKSYKTFLENTFPDAPQDRRALYVKMDNKPGTLLVQRTGNYELDLRHEMTHAIIHASIPVVPIWLDEGLAKYFEVPAARRAEKNPYMNPVQWMAKFGKTPSLVKLTTLERADQMGSAEYRDSWAWTHFLIHHSRDTHQMLAAYLQMLAKWSAKLPPKQRHHPKIPSLQSYLNDVIPASEQREAFRTHFAGAKDE